RPGWRRGCLPWWDRWSRSRVGRARAPSSCGDAGRIRGTGRRWSWARSLEVIVERERRVLLPVACGVATLAAEPAQVAGAGAGHYRPGRGHCVAREAPAVLEHETAGAAAQSADQVLEADEAAGAGITVHHQVGERASALDVAVEGVGDAGM